MAGPEDWSEWVCRDIASRQRFLRGPAPIAEALSELMTRRGYARVQAASELSQLWSQAVGQLLAAASFPGPIRRGVLEVIVSNSATLQELTFIKRKIIKDIQRLAPDQKIRDLRFRIGTVPRNR